MDSRLRTGFRPEFWEFQSPKSSKTGRLAPQSVSARIMVCSSEASKGRKKSARSFLTYVLGSMTAVKTLRIAFYLLVTFELVLLSVAWSGLPIQ